MLVERAVAAAGARGGIVSRDVRELTSGQRGGNEVMRSCRESAVEEFEAAAVFLREQHPWEG
jgi:hypothetical protein